MTREALQDLERLMNYMAVYFLKKNEWAAVSKAEWAGVSEELRLRLQQKKETSMRRDTALGDHYLYEHLIIRRLKPWKSGKPAAGISSPNFSKLGGIARALGYESYIDFINNTAASFSFHELKINIPLGVANNVLLDHLVGYWYCYNRNLPLTTDKPAEERVWRSAMEIYKSGDEYFVERTGKDNHMYYGKITSYGEYVFIIMNSTTFIRQRHFIGRLKDASEKLRYKSFCVEQMNFVSTCVSFNEEPIALYEIFDRVKRVQDFEKISVDLPLGSPGLPEYIRMHLNDITLNRITEH
ncbi:hypothetical protein [Niabella beijingensis]|uniref:hypothetical protein n=1 Tax=Niabella beijingensis TaxID=2872700 RepID=UPI001CBF33E2|nr:hypothetical protein [Niabella beijingensis]MBZ4188572.1 hypothetical protein [Niabella beijingensis]